jgi:hypothetical protein
MDIKIIDRDFTICKIEDTSLVDFNAEYCFLSVTDEEISLVCASDRVPKNATHADGGWSAFRIEGTLDFSLVGILADVSSLLAQSRIAIFAISTYNTDYILTKSKDFTKAIEALTSAGYSVDA